MGKWALPILLGLLMAGCRHGPSGPAAHVGAANRPQGELRRVHGTDPLPLDLSQSELATKIVERYQNRLMAHRDTLQNAARIVRDVAPIIAEAVMQPQTQEVFERMAHDSGISVQEAQARWQSAQEADLFLESGGDPDAISPANAVGVAQWLAGTAVGVGLKVDSKESEQLTAKIKNLQFQIAWLNYLLRSDTEASMPGAPHTTREQAAAQLPGLRAERELLQAKRRGVDERYDPRKAIFAQTRYLLRLYRKFPGMDWLFQAYHGGEGGVTRTLRDYLGKPWPGITAAIRTGANGNPLRFEDVYFGLKPRLHPEAFRYVYGRGDDDRHYEWKLRGSEQILALYRREPDQFQSQWEAHLPGRGQEAIWYPDGPAEAFADLASLKAAEQNGTLVPVKPMPKLDIGPSRKEGTEAATHASLCPEASGLLILLIRGYRAAGGSGTLEMGDMTLTQEDVAQKQAFVELQKALHPLKPLWPPEREAQSTPGGGPLPDFNYHTTGLVFDIQKPANGEQRKILDYVLGYCEDRGILWHREERDQRTLYHHIVPNPQYEKTLRAIATSGKAPSLTGL